MKVSKRDILILVGFIGILFFFVAFYWVFLPAQEKVEEMHLQRVSLGRGYVSRGRCGRWERKRPAPKGA